MSFGNVKIYPFPAVQYIPLPVTDIQQGTIPKANPRTQQPQLIVGSEVLKWYEILKNEYDIDLTGADTTNNFPIVALNLKIEDAKYRSFYVTLAGSKNDGFYQFCTLPKKYFYKKNLFFELFDGQTAQRIGYASTALNWSIANI